MRRLLVILAALCALLALAPAAAHARPGQTVFFEAPELRDPAQRDAALGDLETLGVRALRVTLFWRDVAPAQEGGAYDFSRYDGVVAAAQARGWQVLLTVSGPIPKWASDSGRSELANPDPAKFQAFEAALSNAQRPASRAAQTSARSPAAAPAQGSSGIPSWMWLAGLAVIAFVLWRGFSRSRNSAAAAAAGAPGAAYPAGVPGAPGSAGTPHAGYPAPGYAPQRSGMLGTGLAAAGGVAAGMLASEMLHRHQQQGNVDQDASTGPGFFDPSDAGAARALEDRPIDFGNGADWDSGASDGGDFGGDGGGWD
jgi:hypothetical protein